MSEINKQLKNIAISSYFLIGISGIMLLTKNNPNFSNKFVKSHIKTAFLLHLAIFFVVIVFLFYGNFNFFRVLNFNSNQIISSILLFFIFLLMLFGMYKAYLGEEMNIKEFDFKNKKNKIVNLENNIKITEKGILSIILAYIPFIGFLLSGKIKKGSFLNILKLNTFISLIIIFLYIFGYYSSGTFVLLFYITFIVLSSIMLIINKNFIKIDLSFLPSFEEINDNFKIFFIYIKNYFGKNFLGYKDIKRNFLEKKLINKDKELEKLKNLQDLKITNKLIYIPFLNFIYIFFLNTKYKKHIINGLLLTFLTIIFIFLKVNKYYYLLIVFAIFYGFGNLKNLNYNFPFLYDLYNFIVYIINKIKKIFGIIKEKNKEVKEVNYKIK